MITADGYSAVEHLARALLLGRWEEGQLGMFAGYYDASGKGDTRVVAVAGLVADVRKWGDFESSWRLVLAKYNVPYFHMKEFAHSVKGGPFEKWKGEEPKRKSFLRELIQVIAETADFWVSCSLRHGAWEEVNKQYDLSRVMGGPYSFMARTCVGLAHRKMRERHGDSIMEHVFDDGDEGKGQLITMIDKMNRHAQKMKQIGRYTDELYPYPMPLPSFKPSRDRGEIKGVLPLQAADLVAWEAHKAHEDAVAKLQTGGPFRKSLEEIRKRVHGVNAVMAVKNMLIMCEQLKLPRRS